MLTCNCSLAGSIACKSCNVYQMYFHTDLPQVVYTYYTYPSYDSDRYELVEKKDWRINYLKQQLEDKKKESASLNTGITSLTDRIMEVSGEIKKIEDELKELEL